MCKTATFLIIICLINTLFFFFFYLLFVVKLLFLFCGIDAIHFFCLWLHQNHLYLKFILKWFLFMVCGWRVFYYLKIRNSAKLHIILLLRRKKTAIVFMQNVIRYIVFILFLKNIIYCCKTKMMYSVCHTTVTFALLIISLIQYLIIYK